MMCENPNPTSSKTKDGPKYRVSFEMRREDWEMFMDANTNGMILEMQGRVQESHGPDHPNAEPTNLPNYREARGCLSEKGGPISIEAAQWCSHGSPNEYAKGQGWLDFKDMIY